MRKFIYLFLSIFLVFSNVTAAYAASSWNVTKAVNSGSRVIVTATKAGYKSAVNIAPTAGRLALKLGKGANWASLLYAAIEAAPDLADIESFKPDYPNNQVTYVLPNSSFYAHFSTYRTGLHSSKDAACQALAVLMYGAGHKNVSGAKSKYNRCEFIGNNNGIGSVSSSATRESLSIPSLASKVISNASSGHAASQAATRAAATEMVNSGAFDADLIAGAVPTNDSRPMVPSVPGNGNGNVTTGGDVGIGEGGMTGGDVGAAADAARDASDAAKKAADAAIDAAADAAADARISSDEAKDLINQAVDKAIKDAAREAAISSAADAVEAQKVANEAVRAADKAAAEAVRTADKAAAEAVRTADKAAAERDAAVAAGESAEAIAKAEAKAAAATADKVAAEAAAEAAKEKAKEAEKAAKKAKEEVEPFELPAFCTWASEVCEFMDWVKKEPVMDDVDGIVDVAEPSETMHEGILERMYISMPAECPADPTIEFMGTKIPFPMYIFCQFAAMMKPLILLFAYIKGLSIIGTGLS